VSDTNAVTTMLEARSVAVVGASAREGSIGEMILLELVRQDYDGDVFPVNPKYKQIRGLECYASIAEVPEPVDLVILGVANRLLEEQLQLGKLREFRRLDRIVRHRLIWHRIYCSKAC